MNSYISYDKNTQIVIKRFIWKSTSKYQPHQSNKECARRIRQRVNGTHGL